MEAAAAAAVRYGIVGVGMMGREHLHNLAHLATEVEREQSVRVRVTGLADPHQESLRLGLQLAAELGLPPPQVYPRSTLLIIREILSSEASHGRSPK
jgi:predicted dehydrogenase